MWDLIVSVPDHCLSFYFTVHGTCNTPFTSSTGLKNGILLSDV